MPRARPAGAGRHDLDREVRAAFRTAEEAQDQAQCAERALSRAGSRHRGPGRRAGRRHHRHQHGRPRHRHPARRQCRHAHPHTNWAASSTRPSSRSRIERRSAPKSPPTRRRRWPPAVSTSIGTERHESRRIDNQLRGRSGRQGDPGASKFFLSPAGRSDAHLRFGAHGRDPARGWAWRRAKPSPIPG